MIGEVEHVELKVRHFKYDLIIQQQRVGYTLNLADW